MPNKNWVISDKIDSPKDATVEQIIDLLLRQNGITTKEEKQKFFAAPDPESFTLKDLGIKQQQFQKAIKRIQQAKDKHEKVIIYGDYDVDGITSTAIMWESLNTIGLNVLPFLPHREDHGYGIKPKGIDAVIEEHGKPDLIITVDNGIVACEGVDYCNQQGIDIIICDHHEASHKDNKLVYPDAFAIIHSTDTAGAGVAYFFAKQILEHFGQTIPKDLVELAAIGCIADIVPLTGVSRSITKYGLKSLSTTNRPGLRALMAEAKIKKGTDLNTYHIGFIIAPRLNASGRLGHSIDSLRLICTKDKSRAMKLAIDLGDTNKERQEITFDSVKTAISAYEEDSKQKLIVNASQTYNPGVIGLIAGKLVERFYRPAIAISIMGEEAKGSVRSIKGVNIIELLRIFEDEFIDLGGHPLAAGFSVATNNLQNLTNKLQTYANQNISDELLVPELKINLQLPLQNITKELYDQLQYFAPFGMANSKPVFSTSEVTITQIAKVGFEGKHLKITITDNKAANFNGIFFSAPDYDLKVGDKIDIAYQIDLNTFNGFSNLQLLLKDIRLSQ